MRHFVITGCLCIWGQGLGLVYPWISRTSYRAAQSRCSINVCRIGLTVEGLYAVFSLEEEVVCVVSCEYEWWAKCRLGVRWKKMLKGGGASLVAQMGKNMSDGLNGDGGRWGEEDPANSSQFSSAQSCPALCDPMNRSTPGLPVHHQLPESTQTHVHWVCDAIQPSHLLLSPFLLPSIFPSIRGFSNESILPIRWPKYWSFSFNISPPNEHPGLISFRTGWISLQSKGLSRVFSNTTVQKHQFFGSQLSL